jgi:hypothetical protein
LGGEFDAIESGLDVQLIEVLSQLFVAQNNIQQRCQRVHRVEQVAEEPYGTEVGSGSTPVEMRRESSDVIQETYA